MHLAAACRTPVVALFGPSIEHQWRPWMSRHEIVMPPAVSNGSAPDPIYDALNRSMTDISGQDVIAACERMLTPVT
jgi:heptosyltransferase-3